MIEIVFSENVTNYTKNLIRFLTKALPTTAKLFTMTFTKATKKDIKMWKRKGVTRFPVLIHDNRKTVGLTKIKKKIGDMVRASNNLKKQVGTEERLDDYFRNELVNYKEGDDEVGEGMGQTNSARVADELSRRSKMYAHRGGGNKSSYGSNKSAESTRTRSSRSSGASGNSPRHDNVTENKDGAGNINLSEGSEDFIDSVRSSSNSNNPDDVRIANMLADMNPTPGIY
jgi:hypothetical protein